MSRAVSVIGVSGAGPLSEQAIDTLQRAELVVGSPDNLDLAGVPATTTRIELGALAPALEQLRAGDRPAAVVASGDPGLFGIVRALRCAGFDLDVTPAVSSVAAVFARVGLPWDDAVVVSAHGRELARAANACRAHGSVAVLTGPGAGPVELARQLDGWPRDLVVAERLGLPGERITCAPAGEIAAMAPADFVAPNVVLCLDPQRTSTMRADNQPAAAPASGWALDESAYVHRDSMITKAEVRALAVAWLRPGLGRLIIDVGAGSGSVGIESAALGAAVVCVERDAGACASIRTNAERHGVRVRVVQGSAPGVLRGLPVADAVFIGGGGLPALHGVIEQGVRRVVATFAALDTAVEAHRVLVAARYAVSGTQLSAARLADLPGGSLRLAAINPVVVLSAELPTSGSGRPS